ncbi:PPE family protein [Mycobacterium shinjukuense]|uniref:Putative PPE family protein PPE33 n=1 Tax=Mycobacterium shinjukuense TaxID=398694 RepID=A0A7I7MMJ1_9MYCO|nr:PPE family protein [Mycobacterium shinjukuense]MCV6984635.1 PPE family protein [Mycobacterium shinjukuense]ORB63565.1 hypothetical protein BST45_17405 [Mycobacterium shinjukuense]BBX73481.1 putative PPE family protein PPE33 [Mycobacterium shinjukuense]
MDFGLQPPEITSGEMYSGPGAGPMLAAAAAWDGLAAELQSTAASYGSIVEGLVAESWTGTSSAAMAAAAAPFVSWLSTTSAQAKAAANQARAAVSAYEAAYAAVVPPPLIAANRSQLMSLVATNIFGQNTAAIAATEAEYGEMWAQDTAAMLGYAGSSATAARLTPFTAPPPTTNAAGLAGQAAAVGQATGLESSTAAVASALSSAAAQFPFDIIPTILQDLANLSTAYTQLMSQLINSVFGPSGATTYQSLFGLAANVTKFSTWANDTMSAPNLGMTEFKVFWQPPVPPEVPKSSLGAGLGLRPGLSAGLAHAPSAGLGQANLVGDLSVPPSWASATPAVRLVANTLPATNLTAAPAAEIPAGLIGQMALGSMTGGALGAAAPTIYTGSGARARAHGNKPNAEPVKLDAVIERLQKQPDAVQHWNVDKAGLDGLLERLSKKPGIHAVHVSNGDAKVTLPDARLG